MRTTRTSRTSALLSSGIVFSELESRRLRSFAGASITESYDVEGNQTYSNLTVSFQDGTWENNEFRKDATDNIKVNVTDGDMPGTLKVSITDMKTGKRLGLPNVSVKHISIDTASGKDTIKLNSTAQNADESSVYVNSGVSNDKIVVKNLGSTNLQVDGGNGNDTITTEDFFLDKADRYNTYAYGGRGNDTMTGQYCNGDNGDDQVTGTAKNDVLIGGRGRDSLLGLDGNDHFIPGTGDDKIIAGEGDDTATLYEREEPWARDVIIGGPGEIRVDIYTSKVPELSRCFNSADSSDVLENYIYMDPNQPEKG